MSELDFFPQYWHDTLNPADFVKHSRFLADINNAGETKNASYAANLSKLEKFVMVKNLNVRISVFWRLIGSQTCSTRKVLRRKALA